MTKITFRSPHKTDLQQLLEYINTLSQERTFIRKQGDQITLKEEEKYLTNFLENIKKKTAVKIFAFENKELIGAADVNMDFGAKAHIGIFGITIAKGHRGQGIGFELMKKTIYKAIENINNLEIITLTVFSDNEPAKKLYQKFGFKKFGLLPSGVIRNGLHTDEIYMYKEIQSSS